MKTSRTMSLLADEVLVGDTIAIQGLVGRVVDVVRVGGNLPRVEVTMTTDVSQETVREVFAPSTHVLVEREA